MVGGHLGNRLQYRVARTELLRLQRPRYSFPRKRLAHPLAAMAVHDMNRRRSKQASGIDDVSQQWSPRERLQDFRERGLHPLPFPGREDDDRQRNCGPGL